MPSKRRKQQAATTPQPLAQKPARRWLWWALGAGALLILGLVVAAGLTQGMGSANIRPTPLTLRQPGPVTGCRAVPRFATAEGYRSVNFATDDRAVLGLKMYDPATPDQTYSRPSWSSAGYLGPLIADGQGNLYVGPVPRINLIDNPPEQQNWIYRVDTNSGEMEPFVHLPAAAPPSVENPYGVLGLTIDCETNSLYATSVAGSDRATERGRITRIDLNNGQIAGQLEDVDAIGIAIFNTATGRRLYFGPARVSEVRSVALDDQGNFVGDEQVEFRLDAPGASGSDRARRISFTERGEMLINGRQFDFNLAASTIQPRLLYVYQYRPTNDGWDFVSFSPD
jgi:hypothetical protein